MGNATDSVEANAWSGRMTAVAGIDLVVITTLIVVGQLSHGVDPITDPVGALETVVPFAIGWVIAAALANPYRRSILASPVSTARTTTLCWLAAANVGLVLRSSPTFDGGVTWAFPLVITGFGLLALLAWRLAFAFVTRRSTTR